MNDNEIQKIYQQIEKDLISSTPQEELKIEPTEITETAYAVEELNASAPEYSESYVSVASHEPESTPYISTSYTSDNETYFKETVKNESMKISHTRFKRTIAIVCIISLLGGGSLGLGLGLAYQIGQRIFGKAAAAEVISAEAFALKGSQTVLSVNASEDYDLIAAVIEMVEPSVVYISSVSRTAQSSQNIFGIPYSYNTEPTPSAGSGIIFNQDADKVYIITNYHVVGGADEVSVSIRDNDYVPAKLIGKDVNADLAVIYINKSDLKPEIIKSITIATLGDSDKMRVGDTVLAIGNAVGEGNTATRGIISAKDKEITVQQKTLKVLQTDAAINPGNSGGPLVNLKGEVIGINTAKLSESNVEGMGYSITSNVAKPIIEELMNMNQRPYLGIQCYDVDAEFAKTYNIPQLGVVVIDIVKGSSAEKAGMQRYDVITGFNGDPVFSMDQLVEKVKSCKIGDTVEVKVLRGKDNTITLKVKLSEINDTDF